jgi:hypothetical protein
MIICQETGVVLGWGEGKFGQLGVNSRCVKYEKCYGCGVLGKGRDDGGMHARRGRVRGWGNLEALACVSLWRGFEEYFVDGSVLFLAGVFLALMCLV